MYLRNGIIIFSNRYVFILKQIYVVANSFKIQLNQKILSWIPDWYEIIHFFAFIHRKRSICGAYFKIYTERWCFTIYISKSNSRSWSDSFLILVPTRYNNAFCTRHPKTKKIPDTLESVFILFIFAGGWYFLFFTSLITNNIMENRNSLYFFSIVK